MRGLKGITIMLAASMGPTMAPGAPPEPSAPPAPAPAKAPEKPPAVEYLKAGAYLYNKGDREKASKYFQAADRFRSQLSGNEEIVLEVYLEELENQAKKAQAAAPRTDTAVTPAATTLTPSQPAGINNPGGSAAPGMATSAAAALPTLDPASPDLADRRPSRYASTDPKQRARWLLNEAREQMGLGHYDAAAKKIAEARAMDVKWGFLEETPDKATKLLEKLKSRAPNGPAAPTARALGVRLPDAPPPQAAK